MPKNLILILGDQLSQKLASIRAANKKNDVIIMGELHDEATYVKHHKKKIIFTFSAMRHFAEELSSKGWMVDYTNYQAGSRVKSFKELVSEKAAQYSAQKITLVEPGEWRLRHDVTTWADDLNLSVKMLEDDRFLCTYQEFQDWAQGRKQLRMEFFYRDMRRKTGLLMTGDAPIGEKWNFDSENRKPANAKLSPSLPRAQNPDAITRDVEMFVAAEFPDHFGDQAPFWFGVTAAEAEEALDHFINQSLPLFGDFQDAMVQGEKFLFHSVISLYINAGLLDPLVVCRRVEASYFSGHTPLNAAEGFIRQIIGWREFIRGVYWRLMPDYLEMNYFQATRPLPDFYWTGETKMACMRAAITQTKEEAYAHHIQRLMVTGNFALIAGIDPKLVHEWYLAVYADAYEWVELPNTLGMSQFADGGVVGSKPYAASGNYINKMSDYCRGCVYDVKKKTEDDACPFNALYWDFLLRNEDTLRENPRMAHMYRSWARMDAAKQTLTLKKAAATLSALDQGGATL